MIQREAAAIADAFDDTAERIVDILAAIERGDTRDAILTTAVRALARLDRAAMPYRTAVTIGELDRPIDPADPRGPCRFDRLVTEWPRYQRSITL
jgi:hypothetical protein